MKILNLNQIANLPEDELLIFAVKMRDLYIKKVKQTLKNKHKHNEKKAF